MARHEVVYDEQGLSRNDPWTLAEYLAADGLSEADRALVAESVLSWLREYDNAACDITEPLAEVASMVES